jgi:hypothetical protein
MYHANCYHQRQQYPLKKEGFSESARGLKKVQNQQRTFLHRSYLKYTQFQLRYKRKLTVTAIAPTFARENKHSAYSIRLKSNKATLSPL